jgi:putative transposase
MDLNWRVDETYIKVRGEWTYLYRGVDGEGRTVDFWLSQRRCKCSQMLSAQSFAGTR